MAIIGENPEICKVERFMALYRDESPAIGAHTSGSTGVPQIVNLAKADMRVSAEATCRFFNISKNSLLFLPLPIDYIAGKMMIIRAEVSGADLMVENPSNRPLRSAPPADIDLAALVPSQIPGLFLSPWMKCIKNLIVGGAPLSRHQEQLLLDSGLNCYATYGMTETASHVALRKLGEDRYIALPHVRFSTDSRGCLVITSPKMTFKSLVTNDIVDLITPESFRWLGRYDNVINSGGVKVLPEKIEEKLVDFIPGREYYITSRTSEKWGEEVVLVIEGTEPVTGIDFSKMPSLLKAEKPKSVIYLERFERTSSGKVKRRNITE
ncbi:MAG: AMP-binding protein [Firmicutes bacterium]|nr:AMP-binding protein [Bacillota bacterium]MCM1401421.1 AMP-binding protein [Bacteroides sp.]MCM1477309.1 AMP-binding protein [Bacteroides sp.]